MLTRLFAAFRSARLSRFPARKTWPRLEALEDRTLLSASSLLPDSASLIATVAVATASTSASAATSDPRYGGVGVVLVQTTRGTYLGTGTLIDPYHFVTAAHVLDVNNDGKTDEVLSVSFTLGTGMLTAEKWSVHSGWTGFGHRSVNDDLAVLRLSVAAPSSVPTYSLFTGNLLGQTLTLVGYGEAGTSAGYSSSSLGVLRTGQNVVGAVGDYAPLGIASQDDAGATGGDEVWVGDFDGPTGDKLGDGGSLGTGVETTLGPGDSGGPGFVDDNGQLRLASVNTFVSADAPSFGSTLGGMNVSAYADWIQNVVNGDTDPPAAPTGVQATAGDGSVVLNWDASTAPDLAGYNVYRSTTGGDYVRVNSSPLTSPAFTDTEVINGINYFYVVRAVDRSGNESAASNVTAAAPQGRPNGPMMGMVLSVSSTDAGTFMVFVSPTTGAAMTVPVLVQADTTTDLRAVSLAATGRPGDVATAAVTAASAVQTPAAVNPLVVTGLRDLHVTPSASALSGGSGGKANEEDVPAPQAPRHAEPPKKQETPQPQQQDRKSDDPWFFWLPKAPSESAAEVERPISHSQDEASEIGALSREQVSDLAIMGMFLGFAGTTAAPVWRERQRPKKKARRLGARL